MAFSIFSRFSLLVLSFLSLMFPLFFSRIRMPSVLFLQWFFLPLLKSLSFLVFFSVFSVIYFFNYLLKTLTDKSKLLYFLLYLFKQNSFLFLCIYFKTCKSSIEAVILLLYLFLLFFIYYLFINFQMLLF